MRYGGFTTRSRWRVVDPDDDSKVVFQIKWEGFNHEFDHAWESEENVKRVLVSLSVSFLLTLNKGFFN